MIKKYDTNGFKVIFAYLLEKPYFDLQSLQDEIGVNHVLIKNFTAEDFLNLLVDLNAVVHVSDYQLSEEHYSGSALQTITRERKEFREPYLAEVKLWKKHSGQCTNLKRKQLKNTI